MKLAKRILAVAAVLIGILALAYVMRDVPVPPDCMNEPDAPACQGDPR